jgi:carboxyl-terminal processing protease
LSDSEFNQFSEYAATRDFEYETYTEVLFKEMEMAAKNESYYVGSEKEFEVLRAKLMPDKRSDINRFASSIRPILENEIYTRYYYQSGNIRFGLKEDKCINKAREVFTSQYASLLQGPANKK